MNTTLSRFTFHVSPFTFHVLATPKRSGGGSRFLTAVCLLAAVLISHPALAQVSPAEFQALKEAMQKLSEKVQKLEETHQKDQEQINELRNQIRQAQPGTNEIKDLQEQLKRTEATAAQAAQKAEAAALATPVYRVPDDSGSVNKNFMILGDAEAQYAKVNGNNGAFVMADFAPIFLYRASDQILFEAGFDFILQNGTGPSGHDAGQTTTLNLSFAQLSYLVNDYVTVAAGNMLLPLGTYQQRSAGGWLNKLPDDPLARDLLPGTGIGAQLLGALPIGHSGQSLTWSVYGVNGPGSSDGTGNAGSLDLGGNVGLLGNGSRGNLHGQPSGGGRVGWFFPYGPPHYDLELGISGMAGEWDDAGKHIWSGGVLDASFHLGPYFEAKGEYIRTRYGSDDLGEVDQRGWWAQASYKLAGLRLEFPGINNLEAVGRWDRINDGQGTHTERQSLGLVYFITNTLLLEADHEWSHGNDSSDLTRHGTAYIFQLGYGF